MRQFLCLWLLVFQAAFSPLRAQSGSSLIYSQANVIYQQNFNGLPSSGSFVLVGKGPHAFLSTPFAISSMAGWEMIQRSGSSLNAVFSIGTGSSTAAGTYSVGNTNNDRALGTQSAGTGIYAVGLIITNQTGKTLHTISGSFTAEQWRKGGSGNTNTWTGKIGTGVFNSINASLLSAAPSLNFTSIQSSTGAGSLNGNHPENQSIIQFNIGGLTWKNGEQLVLLWEDSDEGGSDDLMAIDDFTFKADSDSSANNQVLIDSLHSTTSGITNADTIQYAFKPSGDITGLSTQNFVLHTQGLGNAAITEVTGSGTDYHIKIFTGNGEGKMVLGINNNDNLIPGLAGLPFFSIDTQLIDKIKPIQISLVPLNDSILKKGDTLTLQLSFNESVHLDSLSPLQSIPIQISNQIKQASYWKGNHSNNLFFRYIIESTDKDLDGIQLAGTYNPTQIVIKDPAENSSELSVTSGSIEHIRINGIPIHYQNDGDSTVLQCNTRDSIDIAPILAIDSTGNGEILTWKITEGSVRWNGNQASFTKISEGGIMQPASIKYAVANIQSTDSILVSVSNGFTDTQKKIKMESLSWIGSTDSNWHNPLNWCNALIPDSNAYVTIGSNTPYQPNILQKHIIKNLWMAAGAKLNITGTLQVLGELLADSASIEAKNGNIEMNGVVAQQLNGNIFKNKTIGSLIVNNNITLLNPLYINESVQLKSGNLLTNDQLYFNASAIISPAAQGATLSGNVFASNTFKQKNSGIYLAGHPFTDSLSLQQWVNTPNIHWNNAVLNTDSFSIEAGWQTLAQGNENLWRQQQGIRWNIGNNEDKTSWADYFRGNILVGNYMRNLSSAGNGFQLVSNPYLSPINSTLIVKGNSIQNYKYVWDSQLGNAGGYTTIPYNQKYILNPFEAIILQTDSISGNELLFSEASKSNEWNNGNIEEFKELNGYYANIQLYYNQQLQDRLIIREEGNAKNGKDQFDAVKLLNPGVNIFSYSSDNKKLAVDSRVFSEQTRIPIELSNLTNGTYQLKIADAYMPSSLKLVLYDTYSNQQLEILKDSSIGFDINSDSSSRSNQRFYIAKWAPRAIIPLANLLTVKIYPNPSSSELNVIINAAVPANSVLRIFNMEGTLLKTIAAGTMQQGFIRVPIGNLVNGQYLLQVTSGIHQQNIPFFKQ